MSSRDFFEGLGELIESTFVLMELGGNAVNVAFILVGSAMGLWWIAQMMKYSKQAKQENKLDWE